MGRTSAAVNSLPVSVFGVAKPVIVVRVPDVMQPKEANDEQPKVASVQSN